MQAGVNARMRMQLEKVVEEVEAQPINKELPPEHMTAYRYIRALAQEITSITQANVSSKSNSAKITCHSRLA